MTNLLSKITSEARERIVWDFETNWGMVFQPFGENLDKAKQFLRDRTTSELTQADSLIRADERAKVMEEQNRIVNSGRKLYQEGYKQGCGDEKKMVTEWIKANSFEIQKQYKGELVRVVDEECLLSRLTQKEVSK